MAHTITKYPKGLKKILDADIDLLTDTIKVALLTATYTPAAAHEFVSNLTNELSGGGYARQTLASKTTVASTDATFDANDSVWTGLTATNIKYAVIFKDTGVDATSPIICYVTLDTNQSPTAQDFTIAWNASGIFKV